MKTIQNKAEVKTNDYGMLKFLTQEQLEALSSLKGSLVEQALIIYFKGRKESLLEEVLTMDMATHMKNETTLFRLQDAQSRLTEGAHLLAIFSRANELLMQKNKI